MFTSITASAVERAILKTEYLLPLIRSGNKKEII